MVFSKLAIAASSLALCAAALPLTAQAVRTDAGFTTSSLAGNDDGSTGLVTLPFAVNLFGTTYTQAYINNNGNITFQNSLGDYTPFGLTGGGVPPIIAPYFADVDTRTGPLMTYGAGTNLIDGHATFGVDWPDVDYFAEHGDKTNIFQLVLIDQSELGAGDFDFEFNYNQVQWETGDASNGSDGLGGSCAHAGYSNGMSGTDNVSAELAGSGVCGAFLDGGPDALITHSLNSDVDGRYIFQVRNGQVIPPPVTTTPEPSSLALLGTGLFGLVPMVRRRIRRG